MDLARLEVKAYSYYIDMCELSVSLQLLRFKYRITRIRDESICNTSVKLAQYHLYHTDADRNRKATPNNNIATLKSEHSTD